MDDKNLDALTALADKLGTTFEYLWGALIHQAPIAAATNLFIILVGLAGTIFMGFLANHFRPSRTSSYFGLPEERCFLLWLATGVGAILVVIMISSDLPIIVAGFANPEYWALRQILK